jgi:hypothetical protein
VCGKKSVRFLTIRAEATTFSLLRHASPCTCACDSKKTASFKISEGLFVTNLATGKPNLDPNRPKTEIYTLSIQFRPLSNEKELVYNKIELQGMHHHPHSLQLHMSFVEHSASATSYVKDSSSYASSTCSPSLSAMRIFSMCLLCDTGNARHETTRQRDILSLGSA